MTKQDKQYKMAVKELKDSFDKYQKAKQALIDLQDYVGTKAWESAQSEYMFAEVFYCGQFNMTVKLLELDAIELINVVQC